MCIRPKLIKLAIRISYGPNNDFVRLHDKRFLANALPEWDFRYFSNSSALYLSGKAQYQTNSHGANLAVWVDLPLL